MGEITMNTAINLNDEAFARLVAEEVKNKVSKAQRRILLERNNWDKWKRALLTLIDTLQAQVDDIELAQEADKERYMALGSDGKKLLSQAMSEYSTRRTKIERFKFHVERRLDEVLQMIESGTVMEDDPMPHAKLYENAIKKHRDLIERYNIEPTPIDLALWDALDGQWSFNNIKADDILSDE